ncbi:hypothetical protein [Hymenobacter seoulensis]
MEKSTVGERFVQLIAHLGISKNAFAASLDKTATVIQHLVDERNKPGFDLLCKVFEVYPNVSKEWLLQGNGPMLSQQNSPVVAPANSSKNQPASQPAAEITSPVQEQKQPTERPAAVNEAVVTASISAPVPELAPVSVPVAASQPQAVAAPLETAAPTTVAAVAPTPAAPAASDASWQTALYTQQMAHQLALAELRNQHLQEQQRLMQQMMDLMQRQLTR